MKQIAIIASSLVAAVALGIAIPQLTYAATFQQIDYSPSAVALALAKFFELASAAVVGGGISVLLEMIPAWKNWQSDAKGVIVMLISAVVASVINVAIYFATPENLSQLPDWSLVFISSVIYFLTTLLGSQVTYRLMKK